MIEKSEIKKIFHFLLPCIEISRSLYRWVWVYMQIVMIKSLCDKRGKLQSMIINISLMREEIICEPSLDEEEKSEERVEEIIFV
jgi:hypothetical protein